MLSLKRFEKCFNSSFLSGQNNQVKRGHCRTSSCDHVADYLGPTWHPSISVRTNITRSEYPIHNRNTNGQLHGVPLKLCNAFRVGFLTHSHEQSFSLRQKHARWDVTLSPQAIATRCTILPDSWGDRWTIMTTKVKKSSQHRGDTVPDLIKVLLHLKTKVPHTHEGDSFLASKRGQPLKLALIIWLELRRVCLDNLFRHLL